MPIDNDCGGDDDHADDDHDHDHPDAGKRVWHVIKRVKRTVSEDGNRKWRSNHW